MIARVGIINECFANVENKNILIKKKKIQSGKDKDKDFSWEI
jgi:hypothetical protein